MRELTADLFISLDGFACGVNQPAYFGYYGPDLERWVLDNLGQPQVIIMGRVTYEALAGFAASATDEVSARMRELSKLVFSSTLQEPLVWKNSRLLTGGVAEEIRALKRQHGDLLRSIGSISLVKAMMQLGLVDRLRLMTFPVVLGGIGREPIYAGYQLSRLELIQTKVLDSRLALLDCRPCADTVSVQ